MDVLTRVKQQVPVVLNYSNTVTQQRVADAINYLGASPIMSRERLAVKDFMTLAQSTVFNLGTTRESEVPLFIETGQMANQLAKPVILDPVAVNVPYQGHLAQTIMEKVKVALIRGNAAEIGWFAGAEVSSRGIDALGASSVMVAKQAALKTGAIIVQSGKVDIITDGERVAYVNYDNPLLAVNVGAGDVLSGLLGATLGTDADAFEAAVAATAALGWAGQQASQRYAKAPSFYMDATLDALYTIKDQDLETKEVVWHA
ncbi:hydroxyethylthiazole kinase [Weissella halotolerans]|uniref:hydroxyethylthiazole kinase n=1 Tax=Weissella halotolerans TaxID=1615 RepID=UPI0003B474EB|nr:hydroxyethylthiazole kinase [Weissella halotolerans]